MSKFRTKLDGVCDHLLTVIENVSSSEFKEKSDLERKEILERAKTIVNAAAVISKLTAIETKNRELDLQEAKKPTETIYLK